jgi:hypothetical protein
MTKNTKTIIGVVAIGAVAYWVWKRNKAGKSLNPFSNFSGDDNFFNASGRVSRFNTDDSTAPECPACSKGGRCWTRIPINSTTNAAGIAGMKSYKDCVPAADTTTTTATARR